MLVPNPTEVSMDPLTYETVTHLDDSLKMNYESGNTPKIQRENTNDSTSISNQEHPAIIVLDIGGRKFKTNRDSLCAESGLFRHQLSGLYPWAPQNDGSYFIDADPELFEHLLRFMRRPSVFPLFYNAIQGFDYGLYSRLQEEANYFQIDTLYEWIKEKKYLLAVKIETGFPVVRELSQEVPEPSTCNITYERHVVPRTRKIYLCPRQIPVHRGHPEMCGAACHKRQAENLVEYEEEAYLQVVSIKKEVIFDETVCISL